MQKLVAERGTTPVDDERPPLEPVISEGQRKAHRAARASLAKQFAALPLNERLRRQREFKARLRKVCSTERAVQGAWSLHFEPLLASGAKQPGSRMRPASATATPRAGASKLKVDTGGRAATNARRAKSLAVDPHATVAIMALVAAHPRTMTQRTCAMVLVGSTSPKVAAAGLDRAQLYGRLRGSTVKAVSKQVELAIDRGRIGRSPDGLLIPT
jgi:hypothetical protein